LFLVHEDLYDGWNTWDENEDAETMASCREAVAEAWPGLEVQIHSGRMFH
jgi:hypothetical protein